MPQNDWPTRPAKPFHDLILLSSSPIMILPRP